ncbi:GNAT family N-acetyltransferase [Lewinella cohaerens]|uniref:GNAT family N-acetyltransferase n=1 Tax=Lewinella cohaerens TaxID=70995 RepID=UPI000366C8D2|nr:GNAT family N-acetyltransferase [Lewinella cohaerens]
MSTLNIRPVVATDIPRLKAVIATSDLFPPDLLDDMIAPYLAGEDESIWLTGEEDNPTFVAFCAPEQMTEGTWNLYLIAVYSELQSKGYGRQVMGYLEDLLAEQGARVLLVETSGLPEFERTRSFYHQCNYTEEARIRDFYKAGEDKVVFWKSLQERQ